MNSTRLHIPEFFGNKTDSTKPTVLLPKLERSYSPRPLQRSPNMRSNRSEKLILPEIRTSKSSTRASKSSKIDNTRVSGKKCGSVYGYGITSYQGLGKHRIESRVFIMMNIPKPSNVSENNWPRSSFFGLYDGHFGKSCANFLKENLHQYIFNNPNFPFKLKIAIQESFQEADDNFLKIAQEKGDMSGSCAIVILVIGDKCIVASTGDSRALVSSHKGSKFISLVSVHKPTDATENDRIVQAGGSISSNYIINEKGEHILEGPIKVSPGKLTVSRSFGNLDAKNRYYGGNPNVIIVEPDIKSFKITQELDFILIGTDSIFENISYKETMELIWEKLYEYRTQDIEFQISSGIDRLISEALQKQIRSNVTMIFIAFKGLIDNNHQENK
jgi:protein phosphatase PTC2/3